MFNKAFELAMKALDGEELTDDEKLYVQKRNAKYELVRYVYMEKMEHENAGLKDFHFTPGENFVDTPTIDIVNELLNFNEAIKNGDYETLDFGDLRWKESNPPKTNIEKIDLKDW